MPGLSRTSEAKKRMVASAAGSVWANRRKRILQSSESIFFFALDMRFTRRESNKASHPKCRYTSLPLVRVIQRTLREERNSMPRVTWSAHVTRSVLLNRFAGFGEADDQFASKTHRRSLTKSSKFPCSQYSVMTSRSDSPPVKVSTFFWWSQTYTIELRFKSQPK